MKKILNKLSQLPITKGENQQLEPVTKRFAFRLTGYYKNLIDWNNQDDPLRKLVIPNVSEIQERGELDISQEKKYTVIKGLEHKYKDTALLLTAPTCDSYCRYCFRKRLFMEDNEEVPAQFDEVLSYIRNHLEISDVILSGGDPLVLSTRRLESIIEPLSDIKHVKVIRIGSKTPAFNPLRILEDPSLPEMLGKYITQERKIYLMAHFDHPREITPEAIYSIKSFQDFGILAFNQHPIIKGVNDDPRVISSLIDKLILLGVQPYYIFICRPTLGNKDFSVPVEKSFEIFNQAYQNLSGISRTARLIMSHTVGKIEVIGLDKNNAYFRYHRAVNPSYEGKIVSCKRNPEAIWFDDYQ